MAGFSKAGLDAAREELGDEIVIEAEAATWARAKLPRESERHSIVGRSLHQCGDC